MRLRSASAASARASDVVLVCGQKALDVSGGVFGAAVDRIAEVNERGFYIPSDALEIDGRVRRAENSHEFWSCGQVEIAWVFADPVQDP